MRILRRRFLRFMALRLTGLSAAAALVPYWSKGNSDVALTVEQLVLDLAAAGEDSSAAAQAAVGRPEAGHLRVLTLNVAHGRANAVHQVYLKRRTIQANLDRVGTLLLRESPDVVALQEADAKSAWSGRFDHVDHLARRSQLPYLTHGEHVDGFRCCYGTALLARQQMTDARSRTFAPSPPTLSKGFVVATVPWPGVPERLVDVVSVHLDFSRSKVRARQIELLAEVLQSRQRPRVILGDFNCGFTWRERTLHTLCDRLQLTAYQPDDNSLVTFPSTGHRLDWILVSPEIGFARYQTLADRVSDHRGVVADLRWNDGAAPQSAS